jgi:hypothetical protein
MCCVLCVVCCVLCVVCYAMCMHELCMRAFMYVFESLRLYVLYVRGHLLCVCMCVCVCECASVL